MQCDAAEQTEEDAKEDHMPTAMEVVYELIVDGKASKQKEVVLGGCQTLGGDGQEVVPSHTGHSEDC